MSTDTTKMESLGRYWISSACAGAARQHRKTPTNARRHLENKNIGTPLMSRRRELEAATARPAVLARGPRQTRLPLSLPRRPESRKTTDFGRSRFAKIKCPTTFQTEISIHERTIHLHHRAPQQSLRQTRGSQIGRAS